MEKQADTELTVVGTSHYQKELKRLAGFHGRDSVRRETVAELIPEPDNPYDDEAVRVDIDGRTVGYLPRDDASDYFHELTKLSNQGARVSCPAVIIGGGMAGGILSSTRKNYGVRVWLTDPDDLPRIEQQPKKGGCCGLMTIATLAATATLTYVYRRRSR